MRNTRRKHPQNLMTDQLQGVGMGQQILFCFPVESLPFYSSVYRGLPTILKTLGNGKDGKELLFEDLQCSNHYLDTL